MNRSGCAFPVEQSTIRVHLTGSERFRFFVPPFAGTRITGIPARERRTATFEQAGKPALRNDIRNATSDMKIKFSLQRALTAALLGLTGWALVGARPALAAVADVSIVDFAFHPSSVTINANDQVRWTWDGSAPHSSTSDTSLWDSGIHGNSFVFTQTFNAAGNFPYHCMVHPFMTAAVMVQGAANNPPTITAQPHSQSVTVGQAATFSVGASGTPPLSFQWLFGGTALAGAAMSSLTINNAQPANAGNYSAVVTNAFGAVTSSVAILMVQGVTNNPPTITTQPHSQSVTVGQAASFSVGASGTPPLSFQWLFGGTALAGATMSSLTINNAQAANAGNYSAVVANAFGSVTSSVAVLTVNPVGVVPPKGTYNGLFFDANNVLQQSSGILTLTTTAGGKFTGKLQLGSSHPSLKGQFDASGSATVTVARMNNTPLTVVLHVNPADSDRITGTVSDATHMATLTADRAVFDGRQNIAPQAGLYTLIVPGSAGPGAEPGGDSYATVSVDRSGKIHLAGSLADATTISQASVVSKHGDWPLYISLYGGGGSILGWITFAATPTNDLSGEVAWIKPAVPMSKFYPGGFTLERTAWGSAYHPPAIGHNVLGFIAGTVAFNGGGLPHNFANHISIGANNRVSNLSSNKLTLTFKPTNGSFSGRVTDPGSGKPLTFGGVSLLNGTIARGYFPGTAATGPVAVSP
jgi:plastocyanin